MPAAFKRSCIFRIEAIRPANTNPSVATVAGLMSASIRASIRLISSFVKIKAEGEPADDGSG
jgi:hypothetical protein